MKNTKARQKSTSDAVPKKAKSSYAKPAIAKTICNSSMLNKASYW